MKLEKRDAVLYLRVKPSNKNWLLKKVKADGWENVAAYMDAWLESNKKKHDSRKKSATRSSRKTKRAK